MFLPTASQKFIKVELQRQSRVAQTIEGQEQRNGLVSLLLVFIFHLILAHEMIPPTVRWLGTTQFLPWKWPHMHTQRCAFNILLYSKPSQFDNEGNHCKSISCSLDNQVYHRKCEHSTSAPRKGFYVHFTMQSMFISSSNLIGSIIFKNVGPDHNRFQALS